TQAPQSLPQVFVRHAVTVRLPWSVGGGSGSAGSGTHGAPSTGPPRWRLGPDAIRGPASEGGNGLMPAPRSRFPPGRVGVTSRPRGPGQQPDGSSPWERPVTDDSVTGPDLRLREVGTTGFEPATP